MEGGQDPLQFDDDQQNNTANGSDSGNDSGEEGLLKSVVPTAELEHINPTSLEPASLGHRQLPTSSFPESIGKPNVKDTKPSGFGLHLNSIVNPKSKESGSVNIHSKSLEQIYRDKRSYSTTNSKINEEFSQSSQEKKRLDVTDDGGKRCNCKITDCLRRHLCGCSGAGVYCTESCSCERCSNRPDKDTVKDTGKQFASKIIQQATKASTKGSMENVSQSSSVRRNRGCRCKKNMCFKGQCTCLKDQIGCSDRCECEGCQNVYGQKEVPKYENMKHLRIKDRSEVSDVSSGGKMQEVGSADGTLCTQQLSPHEATPQTPSFQNPKHLCIQDIRELNNVSSGGKMQDGTLSTQHLSLHELTSETPSFQNSNYGRDRSESWVSSSRRRLPSSESADLNSGGPSENITNPGIPDDIFIDFLHQYPVETEPGFEDLFSPDNFLPRYDGDMIDNFGSDSGLHEVLEDEIPDISERVSPPHAPSPSIDSKDEGNL